MFGRMGPVELILILCIALVVFGPSKLPQVGRSLGQAIQEFKKGKADAQKEINGLLDDTPTPSESQDKKQA